MRTAATAALVAAVAVLAVALGGHLLDAFGDRTVDALALLGLGLLAAGQAVRAAHERSLRAWIVLALVVVLALIVALR